MPEDLRNELVESGLSTENELEMLDQPISIDLPDPYASTIISRGHNTYDNYEHLIPS